jgi:hypothetical protein
MFAFWNEIKMLNTKKPKPPDWSPEGFMDHPRSQNSDQQW